LNKENRPANYNLVKYEDDPDYMDMVDEDEEKVSLTSENMGIPLNFRFIHLKTEEGELIR